MTRAVSILNQILFWAITKGYFQKNFWCFKKYIQSWNSVLNSLYLTCFLLQKKCVMSCLSKIPFISYFLLSRYISEICSETNILRCFTYPEFTLGIWFHFTLCIIRHMCTHRCSIPFLLFLMLLFLFPPHLWELAFDINAGTVHCSL